MPSNLQCGGTASKFERTACFTNSGVKDLYVGVYNKVTVWTADSGGTLTAATTPPTFYNVEIKQQTCAFNEELQVSEFGGKSNNVTVELVLLGQDAPTRKWANDILSSKLVLLVEMESGEVLLAGERNALEVSTGKGTVGVKNGEESSIRLTFAASQNTFCPVIDPTFYATLTA